MILHVPTICLLASLLSASVLSSPSPVNKSNVKQSNNARFSNEKDDHKPSDILVNDDQDSSINTIQEKDNFIPPMSPMPYSNFWNLFQQQQQQQQQQHQDPFASLFGRTSPTLYSMLGIPSTLFIPLPLSLTSPFLQDYMYSTFSPYPNDFESPFEDDMMSRTNIRRPPGASYRNSPIYYVRMPPTPYMFIPGFGYASQPPIFSPMLPYNPLQTAVSMPPISQPFPMQSSLSPMINLPLNFLANGKPSNIYQLDSSNNRLPIAPAYQSAFSFPSRPSSQHRPQYMPSSVSTTQPSLTPDSKITQLKRPFLFNGRPDDIYLLQNNYNPLQSLYQSPNQGFY